MHVVRLTTEIEVLGLIEAINGSGQPQALDIETTGLDHRHDQLLTIVLTSPSKEAAYCFGPEYAHLLTHLEVGLILHNFKFDYHFLYRKGIDLTAHDCRDTMLMHHLLNEEAPHGLDAIVQGRYKDPYKEAFWAAYKTFQDAPQEAQDAYAGKDVIYTRKLYHELCSELKEELVPDSLIKQVHSLAHALLYTEIHGVSIDLEAVKIKGIATLKQISFLEVSMRQALQTSINKIELSMWEAEKDKRKTDKGREGVKRPEFNFGSNAQLQRLIYDELRLPKQFNAQRKPTVDDAALAKLEEEHDFIKLLRDYRENQKLFTSFLETAVDKSVDGRIYPSFNVNGTVTGRISASNPNLQQLPAAGGIRSMYIPEPGYSFVSADYSQLEVTLAAHFSRDEQLLRVVHEGISLHDITAEGLGIDRKTAKTINFAIQYGAGVGKIQKILKCSKDDAEYALEKYWQTYPGLKKLVDRCHACVEQGLAITNPFGRRRHLSTVGLKDKWEIAGIKRQAFNSLIQGTGADITNKSFTLAHSELLNQGVGRGLFVIHDEVLLEVVDSHAGAWNDRIVKIMEQVPKEISLSVPLTAQPSGPSKFWQD